MKTHFKRFYPLTVVSLLWILVVGSRFWANGISFGLDYGIYQPDGAHYTYRTLIFLGHNSIDAANEVANWYRINGFNHNSFEPLSLTPSNISTWGLVSPRILYSVLSVPFVQLFGIPGMLVIPMASLLCLYLIAFLFGRKFISTGAGIFIVFLLSLSPTVSRWMVANLTDSLLCVIFAITAYLISKNLSGKAWFFTLIVLTFTSSITRFCLPVWLAISLVFLFNKKRLDAGVVLVSSVIFSIPTFLAAPKNSLLPGSEVNSFKDKISGLIYSFMKIAFFELAELAVIDRILLFLLLTSIIFACFRLKNIESQYFVAVLLAVWFVGAINGTVGVNFRYQMPLLGFMFWILSVNLPVFGYWILGNRLSVISRKTQK
jgi:hypothetical protein